MFYNDTTFPQGSWPWRLWCEVTFEKFGHAQVASYDLDSLRYSNQLGPAGLLAASHLSALDSYVAATLVLSGLDRLDVKEFATDYRPFLERGKVAGDLLCHVAMAIRDLDDGAISILDSAIGDGDKHLLLTAAQILRRRRDKKIEEVLPAVLDRLWADGIREMIEQQLRAAFTRYSAVAQRPPVVYPSTPPAARKPRSPEQIFTDPK